MERGGRLRRTQQIRVRLLGMVNGDESVGYSLSCVVRLVGFSPARFAFAEGVPNLDHMHHTESEGRM